MKKFLMILLAISLVFNIAFISVFIYRTVVERPHFAPPPKPELKNYPELKESILEKKREIQPLYREFMQSKRDFMECLREPIFDEDKLKEKLDRTVKKQKNMEQELGKRLIELRKDMTPEEARIFFSRKMMNSAFLRNQINQRRKKK